MKAFTDILGVRIDKLTLGQAVKNIDGYITGGGFHLVVTANPEIVMLAKSDILFAEVLSQADMVTADGIGLVIAAKMQQDPLPERVTGIDLSQALFELAEKNSWSIYLLGAAPGVATDAAKKLQKKYPGLIIAGSHHGYFNEDDEILREIEVTKPQILLVALGMGRQEKWIWQNRHRLKVPVCIGVGGSFDVYAGKVKRAPLWMQKSGLEWLYRLVLQPSRIGRMMILPLFLIKVLFRKT